MESCQDENQQNSHNYHFDAASIMVMLSPTRVLLSSTRVMLGPRKIIRNAQTLLWTTLDLVSSISSITPTVTPPPQLLFTFEMKVLCSHHLKHDSCVKHPDCEQQQQKKKSCVRDSIK